MFWVLLVVVHGALAMYPWQNTSLAIDERVRNLISLMNLTEKVANLEGGAPGVPRVGFPPHSYGHECLRGDASSKVSTGFPEAAALGCTFDKTLISRIARAVGDEVSANYHSDKKESPSMSTGLSCFAPVLNVMRHPFWGRNMECPSEDSHVTQEYAKAFIPSLQWSPLSSEIPQILTIAKHALGYGVEGYGFTFGPHAERFGFNDNMTERYLREYFMPGYASAIQEGGAVGVMCSYNSISTHRSSSDPSSSTPLTDLKRVPSCSNEAMFGTDGVMRKDWGLGDEGYVITDAGAARFIYSYHGYVSTPEEAAVAALRSGTDIELTCCGVDPVFPYLVGAVQKGLVTEAEVDRALFRGLKTQFRLGLANPESMDPFRNLTREAVVESPAHLALAREAAAKATVLVKNKALPVDPAHSGRVCVFGPHANSTNDQMGDYHPNPTFIVSIAEGVRKFAPDALIDVACTLEPDTAITNCTSYSPESIQRAKSCDTVILALGLTALSGRSNVTNACGCPKGDAVEGECCDRYSTALPGKQLELALAVARAAKSANSHATVVVAHTSAGEVDLSALDASDDIDAILVGSYLSQFAGDAFAGAVFGSFAPAGRLTSTWYGAHIDNVPPLDDYSVTNHTYKHYDGPVLYPFGHGITPFSSFNVSSLSISPSNPSPTSTLVVTAKVSHHSTSQSSLPAATNDPDVVLFLFHRPLSSPLDITPRASLVAYTRETIPINGSKTLSFTLPPSAISLLRPNDFEPTVYPGDHLFIAGPTGAILPPGFGAFASSNSQNPQAILQYLADKISPLGGSAILQKISQ